MKKEHKNPKGGLSARGRIFFNNRDGSNLKAPVKSGTNPRRVSFAARFGGMKGSLLTKNGDPSRLKLALKAWGFGSKEAARKFAANNKKNSETKIPEWAIAFLLVNSVLKSNDVAGWGMTSSETFGLICLVSINEIK